MVRPNERPGLPRQRYLIRRFATMLVAALLKRPQRALGWTARQLFAAYRRWQVDNTMVCDGPDVRGFILYEHVREEVTLRTIRTRHALYDAVNIQRRISFSPDAEARQERLCTIRDHDSRTRLIRALHYCKDGRIRATCRDCTCAVTHVEPRDGRRDGRHLHDHGGEPRDRVLSGHEL
jgi:hypothetical protein